MARAGRRPHVRRRAGVVNPARLARMTLRVTHGVRLAYAATRIGCLASHTSLIAHGCSCMAAGSRHISRVGIKGGGTRWRCAAEGSVHASCWH
eukprot:2877937-Pleurochrysis_carterae.AAC.1